MSSKLPSNNKTRTLYPLWVDNRPFHSSLLGDLYFEWQQGRRLPCIDTHLLAFAMKMTLVTISTTWFMQQIKSSHVLIKTRSPSASLPIKGQVNEETAVKWSFNLDKKHSFKTIYMIITAFFLMTFRNLETKAWNGIVETPNFQKISRIRNRDWS